MNEDQPTDAAEREMDLYRDEITRLQAERDQLREQLGVLQEHIGTLAAGLKLSASSSRPSRKSEIETGVAGALLALLDPR